MIWCEHALGPDSCAERENFSYNYPPYRILHLVSLDWNYQEVEEYRRDNQTHPRGRLCQERLKQKSTGLPVYNSILHEE